MRIAHGGDLFAICRERGWDWREVLDLSASINPLGPAPGVRAAIEEAIDRIVHYPERDADRLTRALADSWQVGADQVLAGNGATDLLHFLARVWPQESVTLAVPTFSEFFRAYPRAACVAWENVDRWPRRGLLVFTQPNNPTGQLVPFDRLQEFLRTSENPVLIDESFIDFCDTPSAIALIAERPNLLVLRSLTKFYALPGLRIGALVGSSDLIGRLRELREPWQVNVLAEAAALAALSDKTHAADSRALVAGEREWMRSRIETLPYLAVRSTCANYFLATLDLDAGEMCRWMLDRKIILRNVTGSPGVAGQAVRFAVRTRRENERFLALLEEYLCAH